MNVPSSTTAWNNTIVDSETYLVDEIHRLSHPIRGFAEDYDPVLDLIGDADIVLLGEASHGTHEFYEARATITKRLIEEKQFSIIAVEADWPDAYQVNRYVRGQKEGIFSTSAQEELSAFQRFPTWMWRNTVVRNFIDWLQKYNQNKIRQQVGFYGLDLYSLHASMAAVISYLEKTDPQAAERAKKRYACFDHFGEDPQVYGYQTTLAGKSSCEQEVALQLFDLRQKEISAFLEKNSSLDLDELFYAEQNAHLVKNAEAYYRTLFQGHVASWNLRDQHMMETLQSLRAFYQKQNNPSKVVIWAHNSHLGDARATEMRKRGELNVGQLIKETYGKKSVSIGFSTHHGTVTAAKDWEHPAHRRIIRKSLPGSYEALFHRSKTPCFFLDLTNPLLSKDLKEARLQRAIGVVYKPETERASHYFYTSLPSQFEGIIHFDATRAVEPLDKTETWDKDELPETYPSGF